MSSAPAPKLPDTVRAFAAFKPSHEVAPHTFKPPPLGPHDVAIDVTHCGICHSDLHKMGDEWVVTGDSHTNYPVVPGHEVIGRVQGFGNEVKEFKVGELVGVGPQRGCCGCCKWCAQGDEPYCKKFEALYDPLTGGYAEHVRVNSRFVFHIPDGISPAEAAPLLCAGVTTFSPLLAYQPKAGAAIAVVGIGGLGHLALQYASKMGYEVTAVSTSEKKIAEAKGFGATHYLCSTNADAMKQAERSFDMILMTASDNIDWDKYLGLLKPDGKLILLGAPSAKINIQPFSLIVGRKSICGSLIGGTNDMKEMFKFSSRNNIKPKIEVVKVKFNDAKTVNEALKKVESGAARYRIVLEFDKSS